MSLPIILLTVGIVVLILSLFVGNKQTSTEDIEEISISLHQETNHLKKRIKALEEELMMDSSAVLEPKADVHANKPVHTIIVSQIIALHGQGYSIDEIAKRSSLSTSQVQNVLRSKGVHV